MYTFKKERALKAQLSQLAAHAGVGTEELVKDAALRLVAETSRFRAALRKGLEQSIEVSCWRTMTYVIGLRAGTPLIRIHWKPFAR